MEGWVEIMYLVMDTTNNVLTVPYFCFIIIIGSFFLLNLILAVIMRVFTQNDDLEKIKNKKRKIIEETRKLRRHPTAYLVPLKIKLIQRPKSALYRQRYEGIEMEPEYSVKEEKKEREEVKVKEELKEEEKSLRIEVNQ
jgi:hypothetical protein